MSIARTCDICGQLLPQAPQPHEIRTELKTTEGRAMGNATLRIATRTGAEDICLPCAAGAITTAVEKHHT